ncbi:MULTISPECIES: mechanosensitive ion channel family protein [Psychrilyobacter]|uniref:Mechanosensitive ion channel family protein n=1 Tax=Psychrilyobacter piezotolerans TaxID=2293438 RepID=A0ABX9KJ88_9FUSO|nr:MULTISPECIES: mechanosensitive ion channel family protein [Psychrilyobacter]MCS5421903.1 mechanosensitive ion channel family protein [Psychrilyobacter sp. S5]NDI76943.1 mechanosensitive ion channel family protein [Psychrilyobacter piezotolerans]RDE64566.1 mechanosensitive ion channel family protein [Psychrilyobacter sp. S5]REI42378.1 mechanosensitive ion channel family protein [Psychrilyobacter piezotolerans]
MEILNNFKPFFFVILTLIMTFYLVKLMKKIFNKVLRKSGQEITKFNFIKHFISGIIYLLGIGIALSFIPIFKNVSTSIFAGSGILAIIIGFASQHVLANIVSGVFIELFKPFKIGDRITLMGKTTVGIVEDITLRHTVIRTYENKRIIVPNSVISNELIENTDIIENKVCKFFEIGISYDSDVDKAMDIIKEEVLKHKDYFDNRTIEEVNSGEDPEVTVKVVGYGESSVNLKSWVWAKDNTVGIKFLWDLNYSVKKRFDAEGIEIPYPYRTIVMKK